MFNRSIRRASESDCFDPVSVVGSVASVSSLGILVEDRLAALDIGSRIEIAKDQGPPLVAEVVSLTEGRALCLPFGAVEGVRRGAMAQFSRGQAAFRPSAAALGRVLDGLGAPVDGGPPIAEGPEARPLRAVSPPAALRQRLGPVMEFGVRALDIFAPARAGQRLGIFSGSGLGKSSLLGAIARHARFDVNVVALIGERGREVREFVEDHLGQEGLSRSVVIAATSDAPALMRREAACLALAYAEYFRDQGLQALCLVDSLTRIAAAQREIGLAAGEPPTARGYTPSVFALLPALLERAGPGPDNGRAGSVTAVFSVLVEGDDHDEPVADAARAALDGHIVLDRAIAERGRYPAVNILRTLSRAPAPFDATRAELVRSARAAAALQEDMRDMIRIGAYRPGGNSQVDRDLARAQCVEDLLRQDLRERASSDAAFARLSEIFGDGETA